MEKIQIYGRPEEIYYRDQLRLLDQQCSDQNKRIILEYLNWHRTTSNITDFRASKMLWQMRIISKTLGKDLDKANLGDIDNLFLNLRQKKRGFKRTKQGVIPYEKKNYYSDVTLNEYLKSTKRFYRWLLKRKTRDYRLNNLPEQDKKHLVEEITLLKDLNDELDEKKSFIKKKDKDLVGDLLVPEEVEAMIKLCDNYRDKAFLSLLFELGCRIGELLNIRIKDITRAEHYYKVKIYGKTGERVIMFVNSIPYVEGYLQIHPHKDNGNAPLWICLGSYNHFENLRYVGAKRIINKYLEKAGIIKKITAHSFRRSRATELAQYLTESQLCEHFGWVIGTDVVGVYVRKSGRNINRSMLKYYGIEVDDLEKNETIKNKLKTPRKCQVCGTQNLAEACYCAKCGKALTLEVALNSDEQVKEETNKSIKLLFEITKNPELLKQFEEFKKGLE